MTDKTLPEKARFMAEHIERLEYAADLSQSCRDADAERRQADARLIRRLVAEMERAMEADHGRT